MISIRNTKQKELIINIIKESYSHPTAEDVYIEAKKSMPNISLGTVYRNLNKLVDNKQIKRLKVTDGVDRYDRMDSRHNHFTCIICKKIIDVDTGTSINKKTIDNNKVIDYDIYFEGICEKCLEKEKENGIERITN